jgi:hypothetical protein
MEITELGRRGLSRARSGISHSRINWFEHGVHEQDGSLHAAVRVLIRINESIVCAGEETTDQAT